tara:strand:- start:1148 stop:1537 length:390 start_codon:yes stop_codon:yes gene_type:complete
MIANLVFTSIAAVLGIMLFFSFVVAPVGFKSLNEKSYRNFIRKIFPFYYSINLLILVLASIPIYIYHGMNFSLLLIYICCALFALSLFILMPLINKYKDKNNKKKFKIAHTLSVIINFLQIFILIVIIF